MRLIPFERISPDERKIDNLAGILVREEGPGILAWLIGGARRYLAGEKDLTGPERVRVATTAYAETEDHMGRFLTETCKTAPGLRAEHKHLYLACRTQAPLPGLLPLVREWGSNSRIQPRVRRTRPRHAGYAFPQGDGRLEAGEVLPGIGLIADTPDGETP
ncbi:hypothetical protein [Streptomyces iconiensis]|uniref:hypothetical protein n=1 Tax=Streptomyces iconiensis TaxID=1384038 RepID=UPI003D2F949E